MAFGMENQKAPSSEATFEKAFALLQEIVKKMESGTLPMEEALKCFEEGVKQTRFCQESLTAAELKVQQLLKITADGKIETKKFEE